MKKNTVIVFHLFILVLTACAGTSPTPTPTAIPSATPIPTPEWELVWADEFDLPDGSTPDLNSWNYSTGGGGWGNNELQHYTDRIENAYVEDGTLVIQALAEEYMGRKFTSARLNTMIRAEFTYGRFEARAKLPNTQGIWPAV